MPRARLGAVGRGLISKLAALLMALILMASFYLYALMREDEQSKRSDQWVVAADQGDLSPISPLESTDSKQLASAMAAPLPVPERLTQGRVWDDRYHGYAARRFSATDGSALVQGVRPASASPLIRGEKLRFAHSELSMMGYPMLEAQDDSFAYYYFASDVAAFMIQLPIGGHEASLKQIRIVEP